MSTWLRLHIWGALLIGAIAGATPASRADEIYVCDDGQLLNVDNQNRQEMRDHPCVKAWRERNAAGAKVVAPGTGPVDLEYYALVGRPPRHQRMVNLLRIATAPPGLSYPRTMLVRDHGGEGGPLVWAQLVNLPQGYVKYAPAAGPLRPRTVYVRSYVRKDGTPVRAHYRSPASRRRR